VNARSISNDLIDTRKLLFPQAIPTMGLRCVLGSTRYGARASRPSEGATKILTRKWGHIWGHLKNSKVELSLFFCHLSQTYGSLRPAIDFAKGFPIFVSVRNGIFRRSNICGRSFQLFGSSVGRLTGLRRYWGRIEAVEGAWHRFREKLVEWRARAQERTFAL